MTGICNDGSFFYVFGHDYYGDPIIQRYSAAGSVSSVYMDNFPGLGDTTYDTAWLPGGIWIARDNADSPILAYDTDGLCVGHVEGTTLTAAMGLTMDDDGYLWASNPDDDRIYQLEVTTGIEGGTSPAPERLVSVSRNPFQSSVVITGEGFTNATIGIFDLTGRRLIQSDFTGSFVWEAADVPTGSYLVIVSDPTGTTSARLTRIN